LKIRVEEITCMFDWEDLTGSLVLNKLAGILDTNKNQEMTIDHSRHPNQAYKFLIE